MTGTPDSRPVVILADDEAITSNLAAFLNPPGSRARSCAGPGPGACPAPGSG